MSNSIIASVIIFIAAVLLAIPLGKYISKVFKGKKTLFDFLNPVENFIYRICGINPAAEMDWKQNLRAFLTINFVWFFWGMIVLMNQSHHPFWNPDNIQNFEPTQAFNTVASFISNTNLQHYSGETGASYFTQIFCLTFFQFVSAGAGIAALALLFRGLANKSSKNLSNFYCLLVRSCTRILLPLAIVAAIIFIANKMPMTFKGGEQIITLQGDTVTVARGPVAAMVAIKQLGTNGGGFFGPNSTHPFENPDTLTNAVENIAIILIPISLVFTLGYYLNRKKLAWILFSVMTAGFLLFVIPTMVLEQNGNPMISQMGVSQPQGSMEGKEVRFGSVLSSMWAITTTVTSNGSVNAMHDSFTPLSGMFQMLGMQLNSFYGGVGVGLINMFVFIVIAVFISGLMVGRTPEMFGKKIEAREVKIAILIALLHPLTILTGTALSSHVWVTAVNANEVLKWLNNPGFHGFSEMLYEYTSSAANNGSGFEGLGDTISQFWNISCGIIMLLNRYIPIIGPVMIAGFLSKKKYIPESAGTMKIDSAMFGIMLLSVIFIVGALLFFPVQALGPIAEYFTIIK
jgi:potassium-transporting ATPase potassium-binding subunit